LRSTAKPSGLHRALRLTDRDCAFLLPPVLGRTHSRPHRSLPVSLLVECSSASTLPDSHTTAQHSPPCEPCSLARPRSTSRVPSPRTRSSVRKRCGFQSVVGTVWAMADTDGQGLARNFYSSVFSDRTQGERYYERTEKAFQDAVVKLRRKRNTT
jgi:hypothetical protein